VGVDCPGDEQQPTEQDTLAHKIMPSEKRGGGGGGGGG
jgi:hypothetical protein